MPELMLVPEVAAGATEVIISEWLAVVGSPVRVGDAVAVIETEKAVVEVGAESDGTLLRTLVSPGTTVGVGTPMAVIGGKDDLETDIEALLASLGVGQGDGQGGADERRDVPATASPGTQSAPTRSERVFISPIARKLLRDAGLGVAGILGTGPNGRIRRRDVAAAVASAHNHPGAPEPATTPAVTATATEPAAISEVTVGDWTEIPHTRLRRAVATRLTASKQQIPHFYVKRTVVLDDLLALRAQLNEVSERRISINDFLIRAIAVAHTKVPDANVVWTGEAMRQFRSVDISLAIASDRGLVTPVLRDVGRSSLSAIASQVQAFVDQANTGKLQQKDLEGGSITISNLGMYQVEEFAAIINPPQSAILAVGAGQPTPRVENGEVVIRTTVGLVLSVDHRAIDGALAAQWMDALVTAVEKPLQLVV